MSESSAESSAERSETSSQHSQSDNCRKLWQRKEPGSYFAVFVLHATATALLFPKDYGYDSCELVDKFSFVCSMMLTSFGACCVAVFLKKRAGESGHAQKAFRYSVANWLQAMLGSLDFRMRDDGGGLTCSYGFLISGLDHLKLAYSWSMLVTVLYMGCLLWMQMLIAAAFKLLERTSNGRYWSRCIHKLVCVQAICITVAIVLFCVKGGAFEGAGPHWLDAYVVVQTTTFCCNMATDLIAICSLSRCFLQLRSISRLAKLQEISPAVRSSLRQARRFAASQAVGVCFILVFIIWEVVEGWLPGRAIADLVWERSVRQRVNSLGHAIAVLLLSGIYRLPKEGSQTRSTASAGRRTSCRICPTKPAAVAKEAAWSPSWRDKVHELSERGMTLHSLLQFYSDDLSSIPDWSYAPKEHKTRDVVRRVIIPRTSREESAYAVSSWNRDGPQRAAVMVTHNWGNSFNDLLAAVISDALQECSFKLAARLLEEDCTFLSEILGKAGHLCGTYWICAFAVNQHVSICHSNPFDRDPLTDQLHPVCSCSCVNISDPDGQSTLSEINKFDDMMYHLAATGGCRQVIAVDQSLDLFHRAWCVAEIAEARRLQMSQSLKLVSKLAIQQRARKLEDLDVRSMQASSDRDKELILARIGNLDEFNTELQSLIFDPKSGLLASWKAMDSLQQMGEVGRLIRWGLADAGSGKVWKAWDCHDV